MLAFLENEHCKRLWHLADADTESIVVLTLRTSLLLNRRVVTLQGEQYSLGSEESEVSVVVELATRLSPPVHF